MIFNPDDPAQLEAFLREQTKRKREWDKLDFKQAWLKDIPGRRKPEIDQRAKMELIKDINAMANTFSLDFDDYGFLVLGVSRNDGRVTMDVPSLRDPGVDNLEASIAEWLAEYMEPQPEFFLTAFEEPGIGTWGALVLKPNQSGPFIFSKDGTYKQQSGNSDQLWREGEWRLRKNGRTDKPSPLDYTQMLRTRIQSALEPLQREVMELRQQVAKLEGRMEGLQQSTQTEIEAALLFQNEPVSEVQFTTEREAVDALLKPHRERIDELRQQVSTRVETEQQGLQRQLRTTQGWYDIEKTFDSFLKTSPMTHLDQWDFDELLPFMQKWDLDVDDDSRSFPLAGFYRPHDRYSNGRQEIFGADAQRAKDYLELLHRAKGLMADVKRAAAQAPFLEFRLQVRNTSGVSTGAIRFELRGLNGIEIFRYAPGERGSGADFVGYQSRDYAQPLTLVEESRPELLPGDSWVSKVFALKFKEEVETVDLELKVWAANLSEPKRIGLTLQATVKSEES